MIVFLVKFPDGAAYATGPQTHPDGRQVPGGVIAFTKKAMALETASAIDGGTVVSRDLNSLIARAQETHISLYVRSTQGVGIIEETIPAQPAPTSLIRITGNERQRLLQVAQALAQREPQEAL